MTMYEPAAAFHGRGRLLRDQCVAHALVADVAAADVHCLRSPPEIRLSRQSGAGTATDKATDMLLHMWDRPFTEQGTWSTGGCRGRVTRLGGAMNFDFSDDLKLLREQARKFLSRRCRHRWCAASLEAADLRGAICGAGSAEWAGSVPPFPSPMAARAWV